MRYIINANIVLENGILWDGTIAVDGNTIAAYGKAAEIPVPLGAEVIDAKGLYVGPGFVDIHVHAGNSHLTYVEPLEAAAYHLNNGTTTLMATPSYNVPFAEFLEGIRCVKFVLGTGGAAKAIGGFYMEGPYMNPEYGAGAWHNPWRHPLDPAEYQALVDEAGDLVRVWAIAPEREGLEPFMKYAKKVNPSVKFSVGHSEATPSQIRSLKHYGICLQTHSMNATGRGEVPKGTRAAGPDEYCMIDQDIYTELICDSCGIHVNADIQRMLLHCKGVDRVVLITDATHARRENPENMRHITDLNFDEKGNLSGSKLTMDAACRNIMTHTNCGIAQAFLMASRNPARAVGMDHEIGSIEVGKKANLVFVDHRFNVDTVILEGDIWKNGKEK
jgi:N-acetylglucosamine-6-phosphate deacetylase